MSVSARSAGSTPVALSLLVVLLLAKVVALLRVGVVSGLASPLSLFWQDAMVAVAVGVIEIVAGDRRMFRAMYVAAVLYIALNVPVAFVLSSWLTWPMIRAARGPLADSVVHGITLANIAGIVLVIAAGALLPRFVRRRRTPAWLAGVVVLVAVGGVAWPGRADTGGFDRNPLTSLLTWPKVSAAEPAPPGWRESPFEPMPPRLDHLRGAARGMNVVMVILESSAAQYLGLYGAPEDPMPNLSHIGRSALVFDAAYAVYPESVKGLYAALCAQSPGFGRALESSLDAPCTPLARELSRAGYRTALFHSGRFGYLGMDTLVGAQGFDVFEDAGAIGGQVRSSFGVDEQSTVARTLAWIDTAHEAGAPFFALYMPVAGHHPYATSAPGPFAGDSDLQRYKNALHESDAALGTLIDGLHARGLADRTMLVVFGDHGEAFGQHPGNAGHTLFIHDENVRVPYVVAIPGATVPSTRIAAPASVLDTSPTILDLIGLPVPAAAEGQSLLRPGARIAPFFADYSLGWLGLRDGCWKYQFQIDAASSRLYNVCEDPAETIDRAAEQPTRVTAYHQRLGAWK